MATDAAGPGPFALPRPAWRRGLVACALVALAWLTVARVLGPSDMYDQSQPKTASYTSDVLANGRWILPVERGAYPATKPPLYNWLAAPVVAWLGYASEAAHKMPSVVALYLSWLLLVRVGRRAGRRLAGAGGETMGWLAGLAFVANYTIFKLGYLARPDMLLTLWLLVGWVACTTVYVDARAGAREGRRTWRVLVFWTAAALAGLTKGPAMAVLLVYAVAAARPLAGRWSAVHELRWWWGLPASVLPLLAWGLAVWRIDPEHLLRELWFNEIYGRVTGLGPEGAHEGPIALVRSAPMMAGYYLVRFLPWSIMSILAVAALWRRTPDGRARRGQTLGAPGGLLHGAALFVIVIIALFTISAGKRADYAAAALAPGALLAAWWMLDAGSGLVRRLPWLPPAFAGLALAVMTVRNQQQRMAPSPDFGNAITAFAREAGAVIAADPRPVGFHWTGRTHLQAMLGRSERDDHEAALAVVDAGLPCWIVAGGYVTGPLSFEAWLASERPALRAAPLVRSATLPEERGWLIQATLFGVDRAPAAAGADPPPPPGPGPP